MANTENIIVICEGTSEWIYLQRLNSALAREPFPEGWMEIPVRFIGRPSKTGVGTGNFKTVERELRKEMSHDASVKKWVWVDADIYVRNERECCTNYNQRATNIPPFHFSIFNFEDFLSLHLDDNEFKCWTNEMTAAGHFTTPLCWNDYKKHFYKVMPNYQKGDLPADFINLRSLSNLKRHILNMPLTYFNGLQVEYTFAKAMIDKVSQWYLIP